MGRPGTPTEIVNGVLMDRNGKNVDVDMWEAAARTSLAAGSQSQ